MEYPPDLPLESRNKVEAAKIRGGWKFEWRKRNQPSTRKETLREFIHARLPKSVSVAITDTLFDYLFVSLILLTCVLYVWRVFLLEASHRSWDAHTLDSHARKFLEGLIKEFYREKGSNSDYNDLPAVVDDDGNIKVTIMRTIQESPTWRYFEQLKLQATMPRGLRFLNYPDISFDGRVFKLTGNQHTMITLLYEAHERNEPEVYHRVLLEAVGRKSGGSVRGFFKHRNPELYGALIIPGKKGYYRLNLLAPLQ